MKPIIRVQNLSKEYSIGARRATGDGLRESITGVIRAPLRAVRNRRAANKKFWALKDVDFEVHAGEILGIIGSNGAGKSTLLKVLSRITQPTTGRVELYGHLGSLLEVGTGFHPELTGRENVYLNGAILGMLRTVIDRKFDEIIAFAGVDKFLDTPVKRYSSGMYVRLAFAVAAHLDPEILLLDEVLSVGDLEFQKKCLGKMQDVAQKGRTVLFVSHNMAAISSLCNRVLVMKSGEVDFDGPVEAGIKNYALNIVQRAQADFPEELEHNGPGNFARILRLSVHSQNGQPCDTFSMGQPLIAHLEISCKQPIRNAEIGIVLVNQLGIPLQYFVSTWEGLQGDMDKGVHRFEITVPQLSVYAGSYLLSPWVKREGEDVDDEIEGALTISVLGADVTGHGPYFERYRQSGCETYAPSRWRRLEGSSS
jgi:lipopolysaccharide transport system ATP-binding protein